MPWMIWYGIAQQGWSFGLEVWVWLPGIHKLIQRYLLRDWSVFFRKTSFNEHLLKAALEFHCVKIVQIRSFFWSVFSRIWTLVTQCSNMNIAFRKVFSMAVKCLYSYLFDILLHFAFKLVHVFLNIDIDVSNGT